MVRGYTLLMAAQKVPLLRPDEYLAREKEANEKSEYISGEILAMAGASTTHNRIVTATLTALDTRLPTEQSCEPFNSDQKVRLREAGPFFYPDVSVACEPVIDDDDCLRNPILIVEVLSASTAHYDRGEKWFHYRQLPSLQEYILLSQEEAHAEHYSRRGETTWLYSEQKGLETSLVLPSLSLSLHLREFYRRLPFENGQEKT